MVMRSRRAARGQGQQRKKAGLPRRRWRDLQVIPLWPFAGRRHDEEVAIILSAHGGGASDHSLTRVVAHGALSTVALFCARMGGDTRLTLQKPATAVERLAFAACLTDLINVCTGYPCDRFIHRRTALASSPCMPIANGVLHF